ncbi:MAG: DEAD/DEAH box helicase [Candidatus Dojkabacteria bacterium]|jgi:transcription-repair coupling factor (superfamily II helicase)
MLVKDNSLVHIVAESYIPLKEEILSCKKISGVESEFYEFTAELLGYILKKGVWLSVGKEESHNQLQLSIGDKFDLNPFLNLGYQRVERVWNEGEISILGDVVIIWPFSMDSLVRLSILGEEVEKIDLVEVSSRKKFSSVERKVFLDDSSSVVVGNENQKDFFKVEVSTDIGQEEGVHFGIRKIAGMDTFASVKVVWEIVTNYKNRGYKVIYYTSDIDNYDFDLTEQERKNIDEVILKKDSEHRYISRGFVSTVGKIVVLTDREVLGEVDLSEFESRNIGIDPASVDILKKIVPDDYVVHKDHGIGKYVGIHKKESGYYMEIAYAGKDRLFVPLTASEKITKYIGAGKSRPILTGLNSGVWRRISRKAKEKAEEIARELLQLYALRKAQKVDPVIDSDFSLDELNSFVNDFEFKDTDDQILATKHIVNDLQQNKPMDRLLVGDVGYGKTEIAMRAIFAVVNAGYQAAMLVPTTILTQQHLYTLQSRFKGYPFKIASLSRFASSREKEKVLEGLKSGDIDIVVGTHALLSDSVEFKNLGLLVVDEEQKFGVKQKEKIKSKRVSCNVLSLTATPIPRTLNMALLGIRDISVLATPPAGRLEIINSFEKFNWESVEKAISLELKRNGQVYFLHNRIETIEYVYEKLTKMFPQHKVGVAHGRMGVQDLSNVMKQFNEGKIDILLCTTIIENGLDVPNVNTLIIDDMSMLGLSQAYQIRGRIGRAKIQAYAYFYYEKLRGNSKLRLDAIRNSQELGSGFLLSNKDLEIRGAGDILGHNQSGAINSVGYGLYSEMLNEAVSRLKSMSK